MSGVTTCLVFFPSKIVFPKVTLNDALLQAATDIVSLLATPPTTTTIPSLTVGEDTRNALLQLALILDGTNTTNQLLNKAEMDTITEARKRATTEKQQTPINKEIAKPTNAPSTNTKQSSTTETSTQKQIKKLITPKSTTTKKAPGTKKAKTLKEVITRLARVLEKSTNTKKALRPPTTPHAYPRTVPAPAHKCWRPKSRSAAHIPLSYNRCAAVAISRSFSALSSNLKFDLCACVLELS